MSKFVKVEGNNSLVRDMNNNAILNVNDVAIQKAKAAKKVRQERKSEVEDLRKEVSELKHLMKEILDRI